jgi:hypothetical protein
MLYLAIPTGNTHVDISRFQSLSVARLVNRLPCDLVSPQLVGGLVAGNQAWARHQ